jgi:hypothetical protein
MQMRKIARLAIAAVIVVSTEAMAQQNVYDFVCKDYPLTPPAYAPRPGDCSLVQRKAPMSPEQEYRFHRTLKEIADDAERDSAAARRRLLGINLDNYK